MAGSTSAQGVRTIKRYANRKLYDTANSRYITLEEIAKIVQSGDEILIIDNRTKEDLTAITLTQILFEEEKKQKRLLPLQTLRNVIQSGGDFFQRKMVTPLKEEAGKVGTMGEDAINSVKDFIETTQRSVDELQRKVDERVKTVLQTMTPSNMKEFAVLSDAIRAMDDRLSALEQAVKKLKK